MKENKLYLNMAKGICLIFIIWAHAKGVFSNYLYLFHIPFYFLLNGYCSDQESDLPSYVIDKVRKIYIPYVFWNCLFMIGKAFIRQAGRKALAFEVPKILLLLGKDGEFFGASWILAALFLISCFYRFAEEFGHRDLSHHRILTLVFLFLAFAGLNFNLPFMLSRVTVLGAFYAFGVQLQYEGFSVEKHGRFNLTLLAIVVFATYTVGNSVNMGTNKYSNAGAFFITSLSASYFVTYLIYKLDQTKIPWLQSSKQLLKYLSSRETDLILWHFCGFWLAKIVQFVSAHIAFSEFFKSAAVMSPGNGWWLIYFAFGLGFPLFWTALLRLGIWGRILKRSHVV